jgi:hypothetical protein
LERLLEEYGMTFNDDEIRQHVRHTAGRRKNVDYDRLKFMNELKELAQRRDEAAYETRLIEAGVQRGTSQWQQFKAVFLDFQRFR